MLARILLGGILSLNLFGCASETNAQNSFSEETRYYGFFRTSMPKKDTGEDRIRLYETSGTGLRIGNGIGLGYFHDKTITVPLDCRLVLLVHNSEQLKLAADLIRGLQESSACTGIE
jgi:hypothetical protein